MALFEIKNLVPRRWQASTSVIHGIDPVTGDPVPFKMSGDGVTTFTLLYRNFWAVGGITAGAPLTNVTDHLGNVISDNNGWIDVRNFGALSLSAAAQGTFNNNGTSYPLNFEGQITVERVNYLNEPLPTPILTDILSDPSQELLADPASLAIDLINAAWIRIYIDTNTSIGNCAFFGMLR